jgi:2-dehydro-3-deoxyphosphooctonate aldolase (KDO 8-P synthase)
MTHTVRVGPIECGSDQLFLIAGPCVIEDESLMMRTAEALKDVTERAGIPLIFKSSFMKDNRSSVEHYSGPGLDEGLRILGRIREELDVPVLTDVHYPEHVAATAEVVDVVQIPAFLCMQTSLVLAAADTGAAVNLKHGQFLAPENMAMPVRKIESRGNRRILVTERGYTFGYNDLIVDPRSFQALRDLGYPVIFDVTHSIRRYGVPSKDPSGGMRQYLGVLARVGVAAGVHGLFMEVHPEPSEALCDAASQIPLPELDGFLRPLLDLHAVVTKHEVA